MIHQPRLFDVLLIGSVCLGAPCTAFSQDSGAKALEEVFVSARRQDESLQSTPVAITAVSEQMMENLQIHSVGDVQRSAPNLSITNGAPATSGFAFVSMRGLANLQAGTENDPAVATYIDGVFIASPAMGMLDLDDVQRVEVLRGPQGTLFGRAAIGGALNIATKQPTQTFEGSLKAEIGNYETRNISGMLNVPLTDKVATRLVAHHKEHAGYGNGVNTGGDLANQKGDDYARLQVLFEASDNWDFTLSGQWNRMWDDGILITSSGWTDASGLFVAVPSFLNTLLPPSSQMPVINLDPYKHTKSNWYDGYGNSQFGNRDYLKTYNYSGTLNGDLGWATLKSITAYQVMDTYGGNDLDGTPIDILDSRSSYNTETFTQELQLAGDIDKFSWISGLYYLHLTGKEQSTYQTFGYLAPFGGLLGAPSLGQLAQNRGNVDSDSYAAFVQTYYNFTDELRLSAGLRWTRDVRDVDLHNVAILNDPSTCASPGPVATMDGCSQKLSKTFNYPAYTLGLDYQLTPDVLVYAKTSRAALAGGWNLRIGGGGGASFKPEVVKDVEIGAKADWLDHRLRTNAALFHTWRSDLQANVGALVGTNTTTLVRNAGDAQITGFELEGTAIPWDNMEITAGLGLLHSKYDSGTFTEQQTVGTTIYTVDRSGEPTNQTPKITYNIGATQKFPLSFGELAAHLDYAYIGDQHFYSGTAAAAQPANVKADYDRANELGKAPGYGLLSGKLSVTLDDPDIELSLWGKNLTDKKYVARTFSDLYTGLGIATDFLGEPRTFGVTAQYRFR